jgi:hypothetical protein
LLLHLLSLLHGGAQCAQFVVYFLQFASRYRFSYYACAGLVIQGIVFAKEGANHDGVVEIAAKIQCPNAAAIKAALSAFVLVDELHCAVLGRSLKGTGWEGFAHHIKRLGVGAELAHYLRNQVNNVRVILHFLEALHGHHVTAAAQVIAG